MIIQCLPIFIGRSGMQAKAEVVQKDSGRKLKCQIMDMTIPEGCTARIYGRKPSGLEIYNDCTLNGNAVIVELTTQFLAEVGTVPAQVELTKEGNTVTSFEFLLVIKRSLIKGSAIESSNEFTALEKALNDAYAAAYKAVSEYIEANGLEIGMTDEQIQEAVDKYLAENPVTGISEIYMRVEAGFIQYSSDNETWNNLLSIKDITGSDGKTAYQYAQDGGYTGTEAQFSQKLAKEYPSKTSDLENDSGFITKTVMDLANYYLKSETYSREEINQRLSAIPKFSIQVVTNLPLSGNSTTVYLLKSGDEESNLYTEYIYVNGRWEYLGSYSVDLSDYALAADIPTKLSELTNDKGYITSTVNNLANYYNKTESDNKYQPKGNYLTEHQDLSEYAKKATTLSGYGITDGATKEQFNQLSKEIGDLPNNQTLIDNVVEKVPIVKVAQQPEFVNDISECTDTTKMYVLPNGHLCAYMTREVTTEGSVTPNFTNIYDTSKGAYIKDGYRYSNSSAVFTEEAATCAVVVPVPSGSWKVNQQYTLRVQGATINGGTTRYKKVYVGETSTSFPYGAEASTETQSDGTVVIVHTPLANDNVKTFSWIVFHVDDGVDSSKLIVTFNEEITYTTVEGGTETVTEWVDTGIEYNQPPDYSDRVVAVERKTAQLETNVDVLERRINNIGGGSPDGYGVMNAFTFATYPPSPQLPGDGSSEADFNTANVATSEVYEYMDTLWNRYRTYMVKQNLGKDSSGQYDYYRYVFSKAYWRAWYKENYPKMYAWINGNTVIYSVSVSPRIGDAMYSTPYIGTAYNTVTAVNSETIGVASTRTVNGLVFTRYTDGDVEPTIVYTTPFAITANYKGRTYTDAFVASSSVKEFSHEYIIDNNDVKYYRYPFEDKKLDKSRLFSVFILANEHGNHGDSMIPSVTVMRMLKDLCGNTDNMFLRWLKENAIVTVIPLGNPYGGYNNANNVNINRNYDTPGWAGSDTDPAGGTKEEGAFGAYAGSEIETQYIMNTIQQCKARVAVSCHGRGIPSDMILGEYNSQARFQGCGFDAERMWKVEENLFSMYNLGFTPSWHTIPDDTHNNYLNAGKSPSYIEYSGAVGGLIEIDDYEVGTFNCFTPLAMEQAYAEVLLVLQNWTEEALNK